MVNYILEKPAAAILRAEDDDGSTRFIQFIDNHLLDNTVSCPMRLILILTVIRTSPVICVYGEYIQQYHTHVCSGGLLSVLLVLCK
jgi:hypothetical protein